MNDIQSTRKQRNQWMALMSFNKSKTSTLGKGEVHKSGHPSDPNKTGKIKEHSAIFMRLHNSTPVKADGSN